MGSPSHLLERLEDRRLLSASIGVSHGILTVQGTPRADQIAISTLDATGHLTDPAALFVTINGRTRRLDRAGIQQLRIDAGSGDDQVTLTDPVEPSDGQTIIEPFPATILGGQGNDTLVGGGSADSISGGAGCDSLDGGDGDDTVDGDGNSDSLLGSAGKDLLRGGSGDDRIVTDAAGDSLLGGAGFDLLLNPNAAPVKLDDLEATAAATLDQLPEFSFAGGVLTVYGTRKADRISMASIFNSNPSAFDVQVNDRHIDRIESSVVHKVVILAGAGDDNIVEGPESLNSGFTPEFQPFSIPMEVHGDAGNDTLIGGWGDDSLSGGEGGDEIAGALGNDAIDGGSGNDTLRGNDGADTLRGHKGDDSLDGGDGSDVVNGGRGTDAVAGGPGVDYFEWPTDGVAETKDIDASDVTDPAPGYNF